MQSLTDKTIVIFGASSGLGKAIAEQLAEYKVTLFLLSRSIELLDVSFKSTKIACDISDQQSIEKAFEKIDVETDTLDILINCAGVGLVKNLEDTSSIDIEKLIAINLTGAIKTSQEAYKRMLKKQSGHIINITSTSATKARPDETVYCATKAGLRYFTESLRLAAAKNGIRVTNIAPGGMDTNFWGKETDRPEATKSFMNPIDVAQQILSVLATETSISPSEYIIERGV